MRPRQTSALESSSAANAKAKAKAKGRACRFIYLIGEATAILLDDLVSEEVALGVGEIVLESETVATEDAVNDDASPLSGRYGHILGNSILLEGRSISITSVCP